MLLSTSLSDLVIARGNNLPAGRQGNTSSLRHVATAASVEAGGQTVLGSLPLEKAELIRQNSGFFRLCCILLQIVHDVAIA